MGIKNFRTYIHSLEFSTFRAAHLRIPHYLCVIYQLMLKILKIYFFFIQRK